MKTTAVATVALAALGQVAQAHCMFSRILSSNSSLTDSRHFSDSNCERCQGRALPEHSTCAKQQPRYSTDRQCSSMQRQRRERSINHRCVGCRWFIRLLHRGPGCLPPGSRLFLYDQGRQRDRSRWFQRLVQDQGDRPRLQLRTGRMGLER